MSYQFYSDSATLKIVENGQVRNLAKGLCGIRDFGDYIIISYDGDDNYLKIIYTDVTVPANVSATDLRDKLNAYLVGFATSDNQTNGSQKTKITDGAGVVNTKQLGTQLTTNDVGLVANTTIHGLSSSGGGTFVDVKVNPAGKLEVNDSDVITTLTDGTQKTQIIATQETGSYPDPSNISTQNDVKPNLDAYGNLRTRGVFLTDELSFRDDFSGSTLNADWIETKTTNGSYTVANSDITINSGTTAGDIRYEYPLDFGPLTFRGKLSLSQRIENQEFIFGFTYRDAGVIQYGAWLSFSGTNNQLLNTYTASSSDSSDLESNINITIPNVLTTASELNYKIDLSNNSVSFSVSQNGQFYYPISQHVLHIPDPYAPLNIECGFINTNTVVSTSAVIDMLFINNINRIQIDHDFTFEPLPSQLIGSIGENLKQVGVTNTGALKVELAGNNVSAFGDINVNMLEPVLQVDFVYGILSAIGITTTTNGGTTDTNAGRLRLQTGTNIAGTAQYQTTKIAKYRPGQGIDARFSYAFTTGVTNSIQLAGMGDLTNGYFFGYSGTSYGIFHYNNGSLLQFIPQSSWNVDPCNGKGISRIVINPTFGNIYKVKYPYLGFGDVPFFIQNPNDGQFQLVHIIKYTNSTNSTQLSNPNLSFFAYMANTGNNTNLTGYSGSAGVFLSGERKFLGQTSFAYNNKALTAAGGLTNLFTIRNAATFNTITNKSLIRLNSIIFSVGNLGNNQFGYLQLLKNATLGGVPVYNPDNGTTVNNGVTITNGQSPVSIDVAGTTVTGGIRVWGTNGVNTSNAFIDVTAVDIFIAPGETLTLAGIVTANASLSTVANYVLDI